VCVQFIVYVCCAVQIITLADVTRNRQAAKWTCHTFVTWYSRRLIVWRCCVQSGAAPWKIWMIFLMKVTCLLNIGHTALTSVFALVLLKNNKKKAAFSLCVVWWLRCFFDLQCKCIFFKMCDKTSITADICLFSADYTSRNWHVTAVIAVRGCIRTTIGQAELLMAERFKQFAGLVDNCEFGTGIKEVTCSDLQGFWDMIYFQVCAAYLFVFL